MHHAANHAALHERTRERGVNPLVLWLIRAILQPFFHIYFRMVRIGREHIPAEGPVILASNHRSFIDPFVIGTMVRRPVYYVAKRELFEFHPVLTWLLSALGAFPDWLDADAVRREWRSYCAGEGDNSFFVWQWISLGLVLVFGGATLLTHNARFMMFKPSIVYLLIGHGRI